MLRPLSLLPALVAVAATAAPALAADPPRDDPGADRPAPVSRSMARSVPRAAEDDDPLAVTIDSLSPSAIPRKGRVQVTGSVTNRDDETWTDVNVYAFLSAAPMTTAGELADAAEVVSGEYVGDRILAPGTYDDSIDALAPGATAQYSLSVPRSQIPVEEAGVYWFGAHALGFNSDGGDTFADGRARTFLPLVTGTQRSVDTALVIPIRHDIRYADDGSVADVDAWAETLDTGGVLDSLVDFGASAGSRPVTWLVDPAVPDAVQALVDGNPPRSLADTAPEASPDEEEEENPDEPTEEPLPSESTTAGPDTEDTPNNAASEPGVAWLNRLQVALTGNEILALPYGDVDVSASAERDPQVYLEARRRSGRTLEPWGLPTSPGISSPSGYVDPTAIATVKRQSTILATDRMFTEEPVPPVARIDGRRLTVTSYAASDGGPGPDEPLAAVALRQRILSEAAIRVLSPDRPPLVVVFPSDWAPTSTTGFFEGLDVDWVDLTDVDEVSERRGRGVDAGSLDYPESQVVRELDAANFASASELVAAGETLQRVLTRNDTVASEVQDEALTTLSYSARDHPDASRAEADRSRFWIERQLSSITVDAPRAVTLSSNSGRFAATLTNGLDHPVTVAVEAVAEHPLVIRGPDSIDIAAEGSTSVLLEARTDRLGVHNVELVVTDADGTPLGSSDELPIRSVQVSQVIWVILGTGVALLFGTIAVRLFRRVRKATT